MAKVILTTSEELKEIITQSIHNEMQKNIGEKRECSSPISEEMLTTLQVIMLLKISKPTLYKRMKDGTVPYRRIGRRLLFPRNEILNTMKNYNNEKKK